MAMLSHRRRRHRYTRSNSRAAGSPKQRCPDTATRVGVITSGAARRLRPNERGSGTVIGVAIIFPMLMFVIIALQALSDSARMEQAIQSSVNRAARTAALCCYHTGGSNGGEAVAEASLRASQSAGAYNRIHCYNDFAGDSIVVFVDVNGDRVPNEPDPDGAYGAVPPGGTVHVLVTCRLPPQFLGVFGIPGLDVERRAEGVASIDPYRNRVGA